MVRDSSTRQDYWAMERNGGECAVSANSGCTVRIKGMGKSRSRQVRGQEPKGKKMSRKKIKVWQGEGEMNIDHLDGEGGEGQGTKTGKKTAVGVKGQNTPTNKHS